MENEVINENENEIEEETETVCEETSTGKKVLAGAGLAGIIVGAGYAAWRFVIKPIAAKVRAKKAAKDTENVEDEDQDVEE